MHGAHGGRWEFKTRAFAYTFVICSKPCGLLFDGIWDVLEGSWGPLVAEFKTRGLWNPDFKCPQ